MRMPGKHGALTQYAQGGRVARPRGNTRPQGTGMTEAAENAYEAATDVADFLTPRIENMAPAYVGALSTGSRVPQMGREYADWPVKDDRLNVERMIDLMPGAAIATGAIPLSRIPGAVPDGALGMFVGKGARTANREALADAQTMLDEGADPETIWAATGWRKGIDGEWRSEIDDSVSVADRPRFSDERRLGQKKYSARVKEFINHKPLFDAYPGLGDVGVKVENISGAAGAYRAADRNGYPEAIYISPEVADNPAKLRTVLLHELQHAVQQREGFAEGSNPADALALSPQSVKDLYEAIDTDRRDLIRKRGELFRSIDGQKRTPEQVQLLEAKAQNLDDLIRQLDGAKRDVSINQYYRVSGEIEAFNTEARADLSPEMRRAMFPGKTERYPESEQIVIGKGRGGPAYAFDRNVMPDPAEVSGIPLLDGTEALPILGGRTKSLSEMADAIDQRQLSRMGHPILQEDYGPEAADYIGDVLAIEAKDALQRPGNSATWYRDKLEGAHRIVDEMYGGLEPREKKAFNLALAITSNGASVGENADMATRVFDYYRRRGRMPDDIGLLIGGGAKEVNAMNKAFKLYNDLVDAVGEDAVQDFLASDVTVSDLKKAGINVSGELAGETVKGSAIFGPKIGQGFYQNLEGNYTPLTADRWFARTWGRVTGALKNRPPEKTLKKQRDRLRDALRTKEGKFLMKEMGVRASDVRSNEALQEFANAAYNRYASSGFRSRTEVNKAAQRLHESVSGIKEQPANGSERKFMREAMGAALDKLRRDGIDLEMADLQALLWYPEKELYTAYGVGGRRAQPTDYEKEFRRIADQRSARGGGSPDQRRSGPGVRGADVSGRQPNRPGARSPDLTPTDAGLRALRQVTGAQ